MPERTAPEAALRFVRDLQSLREDRGVSLDTLHNATRVPVDVLEAFEATALYGNRMFNRVYLRSLVRAYTGTIGYDADRAVLALEEALAGQYDGSLLHEPEPPVEEREAEPVEEAAPPMEVVEEIPPVTPPAAFPPPPAPGEPVDIPERPATRPARPTSVPTAVSWDAVSGSGRVPRVPDRSLPWGGIIGTVVVLAVVVGAILWWMGRSGDETPATVATTPAPADTVAQQAPAAPVPVSLPDTLVLRVTATNGPVSDIKIQRDDDVRRPYWIEVGDAQDFPFTTRVTVENELDDATLTIQGVAYPTTRTDGQGRIVVNRDTVLQLLRQQ